VLEPPSRPFCSRSCSIERESGMSWGKSAVVGKRCRSASEPSPTPLPGATVATPAVRPHHRAPAIGSHWRRARRCRPASDACPPAVCRGRLPDRTMRPATHASGWAGDAPARGRPRVGTTATASVPGVATAPPEASTAAPRRAPGPAADRRPRRPPVRRSAPGRSPRASVAPAVAPRSTAPRAAAAPGRRVGLWKRSVGSRRRRGWATRMEEHIRWP
jgi:hypothetical protein